MLTYIYLVNDRICSAISYIDIYLVILHICFVRISSLSIYVSIYVSINIFIYNTYYRFIIFHMSHFQFCGQYKFWGQLSGDTIEQKGSNPLVDMISKP